MNKKIIHLAVLLCGLFISFQTNGQTNWGKYTLIAPQNQSTAQLLDLNKNVYHSWTFTGGTTTYSAYLLPGDTLIRSVNHAGNSFTGGPISGEVQKIDWNGNVVWDFVYSTAAYCTHHDICPMPNGNVLLISYEAKTIADATAAGVSTPIVMWPDKIVEVQPTGATTGNIVWEWHAWDHTCQSVDATKANYVTSVSDHPELLNVNYKTTKDWMHMNGVDYNAALDQIAFSSHNLNEIYVIDHSTTTAEAASHAGGNSGKGGDLLYRWGNPAAYGVTTPVADLNIVHDAHWVPAGCPRAGYLVGFNNNGQNGASSYVDMVSPPLVGTTYTMPASGTAFGPAAYNKRVVCTGHTSNMGNSQQFPNGNMLICVALSGLVYEIDSMGNTVWSYQSTGGGGPGGGAIPQASRYTACYISGVIPATPTFTANGNVLTASTASNYQWYFNGGAISGATAQTYTATQSGTYQVQALDAIGCGSALSATQDITLSGVDAINDLTLLNAYPNPASNQLSVQTRLANYTIKLDDINGKTLYCEKNCKSIDLATYANGLYLLSIQAEEVGVITKRIVVLK